MNKVFKVKIGKEVYVVNMIVKRCKKESHIAYLKETFITPKKYNIKLNPKKCLFRVQSGRFLGYVVDQRGIEANSKKIHSIIDIPSPRSIHEAH